MIHLKHILLGIWWPWWQSNNCLELCEDFFVANFMCPILSHSHHLLSYIHNHLERKFSQWRLQNTPHLQRNATSKWIPTPTKKLCNVHDKTWATTSVVRFDNKNYTQVCNITLPSRHKMLGRRLIFRAKHNLMKNILLRTICIMEPISTPINKLLTHPTSPQKTPSHWEFWIMYCET